MFMLCRLMVDRAMMTPSYPEAAHKAATSAAHQLQQQCKHWRDMSTSSLVCDSLLQVSSISCACKLHTVVPMLLPLLLLLLLCDSNELRLRCITTKAL
jgi:hypothetical protein